MKKQQLYKKIAGIFYFFIVLHLSGNSQIVGSNSDQLTPKEVAPAKITDGVVSNDVNLFTGTFTTGVDLGSVSTPSGLSFNLQLSYTPTVGYGGTPTTVKGVPYGLGWDLNLPTISVSVDFYQVANNYLACNYSGPSVETYVDFATALNSISIYKHGKPHWFEPMVSIPGVVSGNAVFKSFEADGIHFALHHFEAYYDVILNGGTWTVRTPEGVLYEFGTSKYDVARPTNQRFLCPEQQEADILEPIPSNGDVTNYGGAKEAVLKPKIYPTQWYCTSILDPNTMDGVWFTYERYGEVNLFKEFHSDFGNDNFDMLVRAFFNKTLIPGGIEDFTTYSDILLTRIQSFSQESIQEGIDLEYGSEEIPPLSQMLDFRDSGTERWDSLYSFKTVVKFGNEGTAFDATGEEWRQYKHPKSEPGVQGNGMLSNKNPYLWSLSGGSYVYRDAEVVSGKMKLQHGFGESPLIAISEGDIVPGDRYELRSSVRESSNYGTTVDLAVLDGSVPTSESINANLKAVDFGLLEEHKKMVFSTFSNGVKWHTRQQGNDETVHTSNSFTMPFLNEDGIVLRIGPGISDCNFSRGIDDVKEGTTPYEPSAYKSYFHWDMPNSCEAETNDLNYFTDGRWRTHDPMPQNFGIGLPWAMCIDLYENTYLNQNTIDVENQEPHLSDGFKFWWNDDSDPTNYPWANVPTRMANGTLDNVELVRYSKNPYMLQGVRKWVMNTVPNEECSTLIENVDVTVSRLKMKYEKEKEDLTKGSYVEFLGEADDLYTFGLLPEVASNFSAVKSDIFLLAEVNVKPTSPTNPYTEPTIEDENCPAYRFAYEPLQSLDNPIIKASFSESELNVLGIVVDEGAPVGEGYISIIEDELAELYGPFQYLNTSKSFIIKRVTDALGATTEIEYTPFQAKPIKSGFYNPPLWWIRGISLPYKCGSEPPPVFQDYESYTTASPTVRYLKRFNGNGSEPMVWEYRYSTDEIADVPLTCQPEPCTPPVWPNWPVVYRSAYTTNDELESFYNPYPAGPTAHFKGGTRMAGQAGFYYTKVFEPEVNGERPFTKTTFFYEADKYDSLKLDYLLGKVQKVEHFNHQNQKLDETIIEYDVTLAYENGRVRPNPIRHNNGVNSFDYMDYLLAENLPLVQGSCDSTIVKDYYTNDEFIVRFTQIGTLDNPYWTGNPSMTYIGAYTVVLPNPLEGIANVAELEFTYDSQTYSYSILVPGNFVTESVENEEEIVLYVYLKSGLPAESHWETVFYDDDCSYYDYMTYCRTGEELENFRHGAYFVKKVKETYKEYGLGGETANIGGKPTWVEHSVAPNPAGNGYVNPATNTNKASLISYIQSSATEVQKRDRLLLYSPLEDDVLKAAIDADLLYLKEVLEAQGGLTNTVLLKICNAPGLDEPEMLDLVLCKDAVGDYFLDSIIRKTPYLSEWFKKSVMTGLPSLSSNVMLRLADTVHTFSDYFIYDVLSRQPIVSNAVAEKLVATRPAYPMGLLESLTLDFQLHKPALQTAIGALADSTNSEAIVRMLTLGGRYPDDATLIDLLANSDFSRDKMVDLLLKSPYEYSSTLKYKIGTDLTGNHLELITPYIDQNGIACGTTTTSTLNYSVITEYDYYEAEANGVTECAGYKTLMGLGHLSDVYLKWEPSWSLYSKKTYSPETPGAYSRDEYFYYWDLKNKYDRMPLDSHHTDSRFELSCDAGGIDEDPEVVWRKQGNLYELPQIEGMNICLKRNKRSLAYQHRSAKKYVTQTEPTVQSSYYYYDSRWEVENAEPEEVTITYSGTCCPHASNFSIDDIGGDDDGSVSNGVPWWSDWFFDENEMWGPGADGPDGDRELPWTDRMKGKLLLRHIMVQADTIPYRGENPELTHLQIRPCNELSTACNSAYFLMDWELDPGDQTEPDYWNPIYPYDVLKTYEVHERNMNKQPVLIEDEKGLFTKFYFDRLTSYFYDSSVCLNDFGWTSGKDNGLPNMITVGWGLDDSLTSSYRYYPDKRLKKMIDPNGLEMAFEYDDYGRLERKLRNNETIGEYYYHLYTELGDGDETATTVSGYSEYNYEEQLTLLDNSGLNAIQTRTFIDPMGRPNSVVTRKIETLTPEAETIEPQIISGEQVLDARGRVVKKYRPFALESESAMELKPRYNTIEEINEQWDEVKLENNHRSRPLRESKPGLDMDNPKNVKYEYKLINWRKYACDLGLGVAEMTHHLGNDYEDYIISRVKREDEDGKLTYEYANSLGQKLSTRKVIASPGQEAIVFYHYDNAGNADRVTDPEGRVTNYRFNLLNQMIEEKHPDRGVSRTMYNRSGKPVLTRDENGKAGVMRQYGETPALWKYERAYLYDAFGRLVKEGYYEPADWSWLAWNNVYIENITGLAEGALTDFHVSHASSMDWLTSAKTKSGPSKLTLYPELALTYPEKEWFYGDLHEFDLTGGNYAQMMIDNRTGLKGKLNAVRLRLWDHTTQGEKVVQDSWFDYTAEGWLKAEIHRLDPEGMEIEDPGRYMAITYDAYDFQGKLLEENIDFGVDRTLDLGYIYEYDDYGRLENLFATRDVANQELLAKYEYHLHSGMVKQLQLGRPGSECGLADELLYLYDERERLTNITGIHMLENLAYDDTPIESAPLIQMDQCYNGNIRGTEFKYQLSAVYFDEVPNGVFVQPSAHGFKYDGLERMKRLDSKTEDDGTPLDGGPSFGDMSMVYDRTGNILRQDRNETGGVKGYNYHYEPGRSRVTYLTGTGTRVYHTDPNGNVKKDFARGIDAISYNSLNLPISMDAVKMVFDPGDHRLMKDDGTTRTVYWRNAAGRELAVETTAGETTTWDFPLHGNTRLGSLPGSAPSFADVTLAGSLPALSGSGSITEAVYHFTDHQGNVRLRYNTNPDCEEKMLLLNVREYMPFGTLLREWTSDQGRYAFQGQEHDGETGYDYFKYRMYDAETGRFNGVDPLRGKYPHNSSFAFSENRVVDGVELEGLEFLGMGFLVEGISSGLKNAGFTGAAGFVDTYGQSLVGDPIYAAAKQTEEVKNTFSNPNSTNFEKFQALDPTGLMSLDQVPALLDKARNGDAEAQGQLAGMVPAVVGGFLSGRAGVAKGALAGEAGGLNSVRFSQAAADDLAVGLKKANGGNVTVMKDGKEVFRVHQPGDHGHSVSTITKYNPHTDPKGVTRHQPDSRVSTFDQNSFEILNKAVNSQDGYSLRTKGGR